MAYAGLADSYVVASTYTGERANETMPQAKNLASSIGGLSTAVEVKPGERELIYTRRMDITHRSLETAQQYEAIRSLFGEAAKNDAQTLTLARR